MLTPGRAEPRAVVRPARANDVAGLGAFLVRAWKEAGPEALGFTGATEESIRVISSPEFLAKRLSSPKVRIFVAEVNPELVGFAVLRRQAGDFFELSGIAVLESVTGRGIGSRLATKACDAARKLGATKVVVKTEAFNARAVAFYKKLGFLEASRTTQKVGRRRVPLQILERRLR